MLLSTPSNVQALPDLYRTTVPVGLYEVGGVAKAEGEGVAACGDTLAGGCHLSAIDGDVASAIDVAVIRAGGGTDDAAIDGEVREELTLMDISAPSARMMLMPPEPEPVSAIAFV